MSLTLAIDQGTRSSRAAMFDERVPFLETTFIEQQFDAFARRQLAARVLLVDAFLATSEGCRRAFLLELIDDVFHEPLRSSILSSTSRAATTMLVPGP